MSTNLGNHGNQSHRKTLIGPVFATDIKGEEGLYRRRYILLVI